MSIPVGQKRKISKYFDLLVKQFVKDEEIQKKIKVIFAE